MSAEDIIVYQPEAAQDLLGEVDDDAWPGEGYFLSSGEQY
jgi:hypothetical protein